MPFGLVPDDGFFSDLGLERVVVDDLDFDAFGESLSEPLI